MSFRDGKVLLDEQLEKKSRRLLGRWKKYRFVLRKNEIRQYSKDHFKGKFILQDNTFKISVINDLANDSREFAIVTRKRTVHFRARDTKQAKKWVDLINSQLTRNSVPPVSEVIAEEQLFRQKSSDFQGKVKGVKKNVRDSFVALDSREVGANSPLTQIRKRRSLTRVSIANPPSLRKPSSLRSEITNIETIENDPVSGHGEGSAIAKKDAGGAPMSVVTLSEYGAALAVVLAILYYFSSRVLGVVSTVYSLSCWMMSVSFWVSITGFLYMYGFGNYTISTLLNISALQYLAPGFSVHFHPSESRLILKNIILTKKTLPLLGLEAMLGLKASSILIKEISIKVPLLKKLCGIEISIEGILGELLPLEESEYEKFKDDTIAAQKVLPQSYADYWQTLLENRMKNYKNKVRGVGQYVKPSAITVMIDNIIDALTVCITGIAFRIRPSEQITVGTLGVEIARVKLGQLSAKKRKRDFVVDGICVVTSVMRRERKESSEWDDSTDEDEAPSSAEPLSLDAEILSPFSLSLTLGLPPVMGVLMQATDMPEKKVVDIDFLISNIVVKASKGKISAVMKLLGKMGGFTAYQSKLLREYKKALKPLDYEEKVAYKGIYKKWKTVKTKLKSEELVQLRSFEERLLHWEAILLLRWEVEEWDIPTLRRQKVQSLPDGEKIGIFTDFAYNVPLVKFDPENRVEENAQMYDSLNVALTLEGFELALQDDQDSYNFLLVLTQTTIMAGLKMVNREGPHKQYEVSAVVGNVLLDDLRAIDTSRNFFPRIIDNGSDSDRSALIELQYMSYSSGKQDVALNVHGLNVIVASPLILDFVSSLSALFESDHDETVVLDDKPIEVYAENPYQMVGNTAEVTNVGFLGGMELVCRIVVSNVDLVLLADASKKRGKGFIFSLDLNVGIDSDKKNEDIVLSINDLGLKQIELPEFNPDVGIHYELSYTLPILEIEEEINVTVNSESHNEVKRGSRNVSAVIQDIDFRVSYSQLSILNKISSNLSSNEPESADSKDAEAKAATARRAQAVKRTKAKLLHSFEKMDSDGNGTLNLEEFSNALQDHFRAQLTVSEFESLVKKVFEDIDADGSGDITAKEFELQLDSMVDSSNSYRKVKEIALCCSEYAGNVFVVPGRRYSERSDSLLSNISFGRKSSEFPARSSSKIGDKKGQLRRSSSQWKEKIAAKGRALTDAVGNAVDSIDRGRATSIDFDEQETKFWNMLQRECGVNQNSLKDKISVVYSSTKVFQLKIIRMCKNYNFAEYAWQSIMAPLVEEGEFPGWQVKPSDPSGAILSDNIFSYLHNHGAPTVQSVTERPLGLFEVSTDVMVAFGGLYLTVIDPMIASSTPALAFALESIEVSLNILDENALIETLNGNIYACMYSRYYNGHNQHEEPLIERTPISVHLGPLQCPPVDASGDELDDQNENDLLKMPPNNSICHITLAVAPLKINASLALIERVTAIQKMFEKTGGETPGEDDCSIVRSIDIGTHGGFYIRNNTGKTISASSYTAQEKKNGGEIERFVVVPGTPYALEFKSTPNVENTTIKEKVLRQLYYDKVSVDYGSVDMNKVDCGASVSDIEAEILLLQAHGGESNNEIKEKVTKAVRKADHNHSRTLSLPEFLAAAKFLMEDESLDDTYQIDVFVNDTESLHLNALPAKNKRHSYFLSGHCPIVCKTVEDDLLGTVLEISSTVSIQNNAKRDVECILKSDSESLDFTVGEGNNFSVPLRFVHSSTTLSMRMKGGSVYGKPQHFSFLTETSPSSLRPFETAGFSSSICSEKCKHGGAKVQTIMLQAELVFNNHLCLPIGFNFEYVEQNGDPDLDFIDAGSSRHVYENFGTGTRTLLLGLNKDETNHKNPLRIDLTSRKTFLELEEKEKLTEAKLHFEHQSISIYRSWKEGGVPTITFDATVTVKNLTGMNIFLKIKMPHAKPLHKDRVNDYMKLHLEDDTPMFISHYRPQDESLNVFAKLQFHGPQKDNKTKFVGAEPTMKKWTNEENVTWCGYTYPMTTSGAQEGKMFFHNDKHGIFGVYTEYGILEPLDNFTTKNIIITIRPLYEVKNLMPFPIEVFAGINATTRLKDGIMELAPGEQGAIYRFFNLKEKQAPRIQIRAKPQNTLRKKYGELFSEDQVGFEHDGERWTMPLKFEHNTNLVGETCFAYIDNADADCSVEDDVNANRNSYIVCRSDVVFNGYNYTTKFMTLSPSKSPYRIENRSSTQYLYYYEHKRSQSLMIPPMQSRNYLFSEASSKYLHMCQMDSKDENLLKASFTKVNITSVNKLRVLTSNSSFKCAVSVSADGDCRVVNLVDLHASINLNSSDEVLLSKNMQITCQLGGIHLAVADASPIEVIAISLEDISLKLKHNGFDLQIIHLQIDDLQHDTEIPVVLEPAAAGFNSCRNIDFNEKEDNYIPALDVSYTYFFNQMTKSKSSMVKAGKIDIADLNLNLDLDYVMNKVMEIFYKLFPPPLDPLKAAIESIDFALEPLTPVEPTGDEHIYFEDFLMPAFSIHAFVPMQSQEEEKEKEEGEKDEKKDKKSHGLSALLGAGTISSVLNVVAGDLDQTFLLFKNTRSRQFIASTDLIWNIIYGYVNNILMQVGFTVLKLEAFGDVGSQVENLYQGFSDGAKNMAKGKIFSATASIAQGTVGGAFNTISHSTNFVGNALKKGTGMKNLEEAEEPKHMAAGLYQGGKLFGKTLVEGFKGLVKRPYKGYQDDGAKGLAKGMGQGLAGFIGSPVIATLGLTEKISTGVTNTTRLHDKLHLVGTRRPGRILQYRDGALRGVREVEDDPTLVSGVCIYARTCNINVEKGDIKTKDGKQKFYLQLDVFEGEERIHSQKTASMPIGDGLVYDTTFTVDLSRRLELEKGLQKLISCISGKEIYFLFKLIRKRGLTKKGDEIIAQKVLRNEDISELFSCVDRKPFSSNSPHERVDAWDGIDAKSSVLYGAKSADTTGGWLTMSEELDREIRDLAEDDSIFRSEASATPVHELYIEGRYWRFRDHNMRIAFIDA